MAAAIALSTTRADAAPIAAGTYALGNHPDGGHAPPGYGAVFTELYNATSGPDRFTMDFDHPQSAMILTYNGGNAITISGTSWGGRDIGETYASDAYQGLYHVSFTYAVGVGFAGGDDDIDVNAPAGANVGTIKSPLGDLFTLSDLPMGGYTFRLGDENNDLGHRGFPAISGWGWMAIDGVDSSPTDWLFTAELVPEPATGLLLLAVTTCIVRRRRK
jgi:hypothetical protein